MMTASKKNETNSYYFKYSMLWKNHDVECRWFLP